MNIGKKFIMIIALAVLGLLLGGFFLKKSFFDSPFKSNLLAEETIISTEWIEIEARDLIKLKGDHQFLTINLIEPFEGDFSKGGVKTINGDIFNFEVKLKDEEGQEYPLIYDGFLGKMNINYGYKRGKLPDNKTYKSVLIRSDIPIKVKKILWIYYYDKDLR